MRPLQLQKRSMAVAGLIMVAYLLFHMLSNLSFISEPRFDAFYHWYNGSMLRWLVFAVVLGCLLFHVKTAVKIRKMNAGVRAIGYSKHDHFEMPASLVTLSIILLFLFIILHIVQALNFDPAQTYTELILLFKSPLMVLIYLGGLFILAMHLQHSLANVLQTLGITSKTCHFAVVSAVIVLAAGFALIPLMAFWSGL